MKYEKYTSLIKDLEKYAEENPKAYEWKVAGLGALGYAYFFGLFLTFILVPILLVGLIIFMPSIVFAIIKVAGNLIFIVVIGIFLLFKVIWDLVRSIWTKVQAPEGYEITNQDSPKLFEIVDKTCAFLKAQRPDHILLIEDFNAAVVTLPRFGVFGKKVYLLVGLPLMQAISPKQFEAVLAHEIGHISEKHSRFSNWAYRLKETWGRFIESQEIQGNNLYFLYSGFLNWYFPYFNAYSFVLCRKQEKEADEYAVQLVGAKYLGESLINIDIKSRNLSDKFWKEVLDEAIVNKTPPTQLFTRMAKAFRESDKPQDLKNLSKAVAINTGYNDSHPSLAERLKAIGYWTNSDLPMLPEEVSETASQAYLGNLEEKYSKIFNEVWQERVKEQWQQRHDFLLEVQKRLDELNEKSKTETLSANELYEKACLIAEKYGTKESFATLKEIVEKHPEHANAIYAIGTILLEEDNAEGIEYIKKAISFDRTLKMSGCETIYYFLRSKGQDEEAKKYVIDIENEEDEIALANQERNSIWINDKFTNHDFSEEKIANICKKIQYYDEIQALYLVRKDVKYYSELPFYVLFIQTSKKKWLNSEPQLNAQELIDIAVERLSEFGIHYFAILEGNLASIKPQLDEIENAKIFIRE